MTQLFVGKNNCMSQKSLFSSYMYLCHRTIWSWVI